MHLIPIVEATFPEGTGPQWNVGEGAIVFQSGGNGKYGRVIHVMNLNADGEQTFDGMLRAESGGALFLPIDDEGRIGLQLRMRPQTTKSSSAWKADYAAGKIDFSAIGRESWELPRGFGGFNESGEQTARREAEEEAGGRVTSIERLYWANDNTASAPHMTFISMGMIDLEATPREDDPNEPMLSGLTFFAKAELADLIREGTLYCNFTLGAIGAYMLLKN